MSDILDRLSGIAPDLLEQTGITLWLVVASLIFGGIGGLVVGTTITVTRRGAILEQPVVYGILNALVNTIRPIPFIIFLVAMQPLARAVVGRGIGNEAIIFALSLAATFGIARIVEQNLVTVDPGVIEAARSTGASPWRIIRTVILPEGAGPLILGYTFATVALIDMSAVAGMAGGEGLGNYAVAYGFRQFDEVVTWSALVIIIVVTQVVQGLGNWLARRILRR
ncbi:methionine ABC transporter permease [Microbacterium paludicola]|jgi:D-methionine transport system permease protein|uniref:ABC transporter permease n=1 Tax=Microbacterium paludicola TaxID=300019 RepID=A0A4Y9FTP9_9MICO|nr:methionine ABC transporter permease [Microbacterium paludicola]MBF0816736.1 ABC transporter permease [Microbacterium paludicola]TFU32612.1 ABC transporter permease [Microbacterium paludicola]